MYIIKSSIRECWEDGWTECGERGERERGGWGVEGTGKKLGKLRERKKGMGKESERGEVRGE